MSSPIFSVDEEDLQLGNINSIYKHRYSSYSSWCSNCIKNDIDSNAFVLISNIVLPNILVVAVEFKDFNPNIELSDKIINKDISYSKFIFEKKISLNENKLIFYYII